MATCHGLGGMRGALALALALSIEKELSVSKPTTTLTFGVVAFTIVVQGITMKPLIRMLGISTSGDDDYSCARIRQWQFLRRLELESMASQQSFHVTYMHNCTKSFTEDWKMQTRLWILSGR